MPVEQDEMEFYDGTIQGTVTQIDPHNLFNFWHRSGTVAGSEREIRVGDKT